MLDGGLVLSLQHRQNRAHLRLNPCYVGRWTSTLGLMNPLYGAKLRLNPCYVGRWTSTLMNLLVSFFVKMDLILVMLDGGLVLVIIRLY